MSASLLCGLMLGAGGSLAFYLASPNQRWRARPLPARFAREAGAALLVAALGALCFSLQLLVACYVLLTWLMLLWIALPYLGALRERAPVPREPR